jgi:hypothetical protein
MTNAELSKLINSDAPWVFMTYAGKGNWDVFTFLTVGDPDPKYLGTCWAG